MIKKTLNDEDKMPREDDLEKALETASNNFQNGAVSITTKINKSLVQDFTDLLTNKGYKMC